VVADRLHGIAGRDSEPGIDAGCLGHQPVTDTFEEAGKTAPGLAAGSPAAGRRPSRYRCTGSAVPALRRCGVAVQRRPEQDRPPPGTGTPCATAPQPPRQPSPTTDKPKTIPAGAHPERTST
jgi:hypothetical protein